MGKRRTSRSPARSTPLRSNSVLALRENTITSIHEEKRVALIRAIISLALHLIILVALISIYLRTYHPARDVSTTITVTAPMNDSMLIALQQEISTLKQELAEMKQMRNPTPSCNLPDGTGLADFALKSAGGSVVFPHTFSLFANSPDTVLTPNVNVGECWPCRLPNCKLTIRLVNRIRVKQVSIEHTAKALQVSREDTAPKRFTVRDHESNVVLGSFEYSRVGVQTFTLQEQQVETQLVDLDIHSVWGTGEVACLYRFRVHGELIS